MIPIFYSEQYTADIGSHVMPIRKFGLVRDAIVNSKLPVDWRTPSPVTTEDLLLVHTQEYIDAINTGEPKALAESQKFPWSKALADAVRYTNGGCVEALDAALRESLSER